MKRRLSAIAVLLGLLAALPSASGDAYVTVLHFNDYHGYLQARRYGQENFAVMSRISTAIQEVRDWNDAHDASTLVFVAGDILQGTPLSTVYKGEPDVLALNLMDLDAMCVGNHEFDFGFDNFQKLHALARFPILAANIYVKETGEHLTTPFVSLTLADGTKGAAFGLTTPDTAVQTSPKNVEQLYFTDAIEEARKLVLELPKEAQFIVAVTHLGHDEDLELAAAVPEIDLIVGGHSHTAVEAPVQVGKTLVVQTGGYGQTLGQVDMLVSEGDVVKYRGFLREVGPAITPDPQVQAIVDKYANQLDDRLREVIAHTTVRLDGEHELSRAQETNLGNLVTDIIRDYARADVCLWNAGGIRSSIEAGPITFGDILTVVPFGNIIATKPVSGEQLRQVLEFNAAQTRPFGGFLQVSGLTMEIEGNRLGKVMVGDRPLDPSATYLIATSEFMLAGGDGYAMLMEGVEPTYLGYSESAVVLEGLRAMGTVSPKVEGRIVIK
jgi:2',3'-cyclic-nucleotide 2'-phosphodiesterase (5'-nucleotidase family)